MRIEVETISKRFGDFTAVVPWRASDGAVPPYPVPSNHKDQADIRTAVVSPPQAASPDAVAVLNVPGPSAAALRAEIRRLVIEELAALTGR